MRRLLIISAAALFMWSCGNQQAKTADNAKPAARVGNERLSVQEVLAAVPSGLSEQDSAEFVRHYIDRWIDRQLIGQAAANVLDMDDIDRRVEKYRQDLITAEYRRYCFDNRTDTSFTREQLKEYYDRHPELFRTAHPMIKGIYLKVPSDTEKLRDIRRLLQQGRKSDIDKLEGIVAGTAIHYDYFLDKWIEWRRIEQIIPTRFETEPEAVLLGRRMLDLNLSGFTYLLKVTEYLPAGATMPFEQAIPQIRQRLTNRQRMNFDATFIQQLRLQAEKDGKIEINN